MVGLDGQLDFLAVQSERVAGFDFAANINVRRRILAHQHRGQTGSNARALQFFDLRGRLQLNFVANFVAVQNARAQAIRFPLLTVGSLA